MQHVVVFDLETVPDLDVGRTLLGLTAEAQDGEIRMELCARYAKADQDPAEAFVKVPLHRIICIGALYAERAERSMPWAVTRCGVGHIGQRPERELVSGFINSLAGPLGPQLVGFNSSGFDLPVLRYRAMALGIPANLLHGGNGIDYWYRYGKGHLDLCDILSGFRASTPPSLAEVAALCGVPVKIDGMDGGQVEPLLAAGRLSEIAAYCETDVIATFLVFLRYALVVGDLSAEAYTLSRAGLCQFLEERLAKRPHFGGYVETLSRGMEQSPTIGADLVSATA
jgi:3'-5' exonuclease